MSFCPALNDRAKTHAWAQLLDVAITFTRPRNSCHLLTSVSLSFVSKTSTCTLGVQARAHLLNVGIIRPREDVSAIDINAFLSSPEGAPPSVGRIADADKIDIARFLNR